MRLRAMMMSAVVAGSAGVLSPAALGQTAVVPRSAVDRPAERRAEIAPAAREDDAQSAPPPTASSQDQPGEPATLSTRTAAGRDLLRENGNSLLRASIASRPDSAQARDVSFYSVPIPEPKVIRKHDLVTIIIREESTYSSDASTESKRTSTLDAAITDFIKLKLKNFEIEGGGLGPIPPKVSGNVNRNFKGEGTVDRSDKFSARITAEVLDVKPNGTLVLQARKRIKTDEEEQVFTLTGTCRAEDITADNSIISTALHDQELTKTHKGTVRNASRKGWGGKLLDAISPF